MRKALLPVLGCALIAAPALAAQVLGVGLVPQLGLLIFGAAVVAASFVLAWAAESAEADISGGLAIAILAVIAVLPEYAVDLYFAYSAGHNSDYVQYAAANMTGSNRLLLGLGWSAVVVVSLLVASRRAGTPVSTIVLDSRYRLELGFLLVASLLALLVPATGQIHLVFGLMMLALFIYYLVRVSGGEEEETEHLVGPAARIAALPARSRRPIIIAMFVGAAVTILLCAAPFAESLIGSGEALGVDRFLLVQWLAPLASEAPEFIVALIFAIRGRAGMAIGMLISAKVNQWTLLVGSLPVAYLVGGGGTTMVLDVRQVEEIILTATQTLMGVAILLALRFRLWAAIALFGLFAVQFAIPGTQGRLILSAIYLAISAVLFVVHRRQLWPTLSAPFRRRPVAAPSQRHFGPEPRTFRSRNHARSG